jgi:hypothetical protein
VLEVDDIVAFFEFGEIDVERRTHCRGARRFQPARTLDFVSSEDFRVGDDGQFCFMENEATAERAEVQGGAGILPAASILHFLSGWKHGDGSLGP